ncbi:MAG: hypothetical protein ACLTYB_14665 [Clostridium paraputrificum]
MEKVVPIEGFKVCVKREKSSDFKLIGDINYNMVQEYFTEDSLEKFKIKQIIIEGLSYCTVVGLKQI